MLVRYTDDLFSHKDMFPTLLAAAGVPDVKEQLHKGMKVGKKSVKVHLDGYNIMDRLAGKGPNPRREFFYWNDDGSLVGLRFDNWPDKPFTEERTILVAGCGTSQAAKHAARCPAARVIGIDGSATSVRHTEDLQRKYDLHNLAVFQLSIDRVRELGRTFDEIVCTGVLHHLEDPEAALRALRGVLVPDGAMHLMVYAPCGRAGIYMLQEFCRRIGIRASDDEIRDLVVGLGALPARHPLARLLHDVPDFDDWLDYVPVRVPDTLCVQERLPPGAAAVLINRVHTDTDIYLPIDAREKLLVDAIDGKHSIGEIAGDEQRDVCRTLFERLWWHDQVVFDASQAELAHSPAPRGTV